MTEMKISKLSVASILLFIFIWEATVKFNLLPAALPAPSGVARAFTYIAGNLPSDILSSLLHFSSGFALAAAVAIPLGMLTGWFGVARKAVEPIVELFRPIPPIAWIPFALLAFISYLQASAFIIFIGAFFPLITNTYMGFRQTRAGYIEVAKVFGASEFQVVSKVAFPSALPYIFTGVRVAIGVAWMSVVAAELFVPSGLGWMIMQMRYLHDINAVVAYMIVIGALGFAMERCARLLERRVLRWQKGLLRGG